jgi:hypothetical protein
MEIKKFVEKSLPVNLGRRKLKEGRFVLSRTQKAFIRHLKRQLGRRLTDEECHEALKQIRALRIEQDLSYLKNV